MPHPRSEELCKLALDSDAEGVLSIVTLDEIAQEWCAHLATKFAASDVDPDDPFGWVERQRALVAAERDREPGGEYWPVWFFIMCLPKVPHLQRELLLKLVEHAPNDDVLSAIGAGPFEDWLYSSPAEMQWAEAEAWKDPRFQRALDNTRFP
jgi:hypothetical protein